MGCGCVGWLPFGVGTFFLVSVALCSSYSGAPWTMARILSSPSSSCSLACCFCIACNTHTWQNLQHPPMRWPKKINGRETLSWGESDMRIVSPDLSNWSNSLCFALSFLWSTCKMEKEKERKRKVKGWKVEVQGDLRMVPYIQWRLLCEGFPSRRVLLGEAHSSLNLHTHSLNLHSLTHSTCTMEGRKKMKKEKGGCRSLTKEPEALHHPLPSPFLPSPFLFLSRHLP